MTNFRSIFFPAGRYFSLIIFINVRRVTNAMTVIYDATCSIDNVHFHGHKFAVMAMRFPKYDPVTGHASEDNDDISCQGSDLCWNATWKEGRVQFFQNVTQPPIKDTVVIPTSGYVVLRFRTTNPGPFMLHCHIDDHVIEGMAMIIDIAPDKRPQYPSGFPTCLPTVSTTTKKTTPKVTTTKPK
jgi:hypothetical protein